MKTINKKPGKIGRIRFALLGIASLMILFVYSCESDKGTTAIQSSEMNQEPTDESKRSFTDKEITQAVERELLAQDGVLSYKIDVETQEGVVQLTGTTDNILAKERATDVAKMVKGVVGVINLVNVKASNITDSELEQSIEKAFLMDPATDLYEVTAEVNDGVVNLTGVVESWQEKRLAAKVAKGVKGVRDLENNITFNYTDARSDSEIENDITQKLKWDIRVDDALINVGVTDGQVRLSGTVGSAAEHSQAEVDAWVAGVKSVDVEDLRVARWARDEDLRKDKYIEKSEDDIKEAVKDAFFYDPRVYSFNPEVEISDGVVTLSGSVDNLQAKKAAEKVAKTIVGVWKVNNMLKVRIPTSYSDEEVKADIASALLVDPYVDRFEIDLSVNDGVVYLDGEVNNYFEKYHAEDVTSSINGVYVVDNNIDVTGVDPVPYAFDYSYRHYYPYITYDHEAYLSVRKDMEIKDDIETQFWWSPYVDLEEIEVTIDDGIATLSGTVDSWLEYDLAERNAYDGGAVAVDNNLIVQNK